MGPTGFVPETNSVIDISQNETIAIGIDVSAQLPIQHDYLGNPEPVDTPTFSQPQNVTVSIFNADGSAGPSLPNAAYVVGSEIVQLVPGSLLTAGVGYTLRATWQNNDATSTYLSEIQLRVAEPAPTSFSWAPSLTEVSSLVPNMAQDASGTFTSTTFPSATTVTNLVADVCAEVAAFAGNPDVLAVDATDPARVSALATLKSTASRVAAHGVAAQIEVSYSAQDHRENRWGRVEHLRTVYNDGINRLRKAIGEFSQGQNMGGQNDQSEVRVSAPEKQGWTVPPGYMLDRETNTFCVDPNWGIW